MNVLCTSKVIAFSLLTTSVVCQSNENTSLTSNAIIAVEQKSSFLVERDNLMKQIIASYNTIAVTPPLSMQQQTSYLQYLIDY